MKNVEKCIQNVYLIEGENFRFLFTAVSCGRHHVGPRYVIFQDCQTQKRYTGTVAPGGTMAIITIPKSRQHLAVDMAKPFLTNNRG